MSNPLTFAIALVVLVALLFVIERFVALRRSSRPLLGRLLVNIAFSVLAFAVAMVVVRPAALAVLEWAEGNLMLVTPRMHGIHHSQVRNEANSNYSVVFSWWDRLHRTLGLNIPQSDLAIGVPGYADPADNRLWTDLLLPFRRQRDYWRRKDGMPVARERATLPGRRSRLAE